MSAFRVIDALSDLTTLQLSVPADYVLQLTLNRPAVRNAINSTMMRELHQFWSYLQQDYRDVRCIIMTGAGDKAFCAGADLKEREGLDLATWRQQHIPLEQAVLALLDCPVPVIAAVNAAAFGGGLELALAADFIYAVSTAQFAQSEVKLGIMPGAMGTQQLARAVGLRRAKELTFSAQPFSAAEAEAWGLVNAVYPPEGLMPAVLVTAQRIAGNAPFAVRQAKKAIQVSSYTDYKTGYAFELEAYYRLLPTQDRIEGINAFNQKRLPVFTDE